MIMVQLNIDGVLLYKSDPHDDVTKRKPFHHYWPFVRGIDQLPMKFPPQRPVTRSFDVFFDQRLNRRFSKQS